MSKLNDLTFGLIGDDALSWFGRRGPGAPVAPALVWATKPATTGIIGDTITGSWSGGTAPYHAVLKNPAGTTVKDQTGSGTSVSYSTVDGTDAAGAYVLTVTDAEGKSLTATTTMAAAMKITAQPGPYSLFQEGGKMDITGAAVQGANSLSWQKLAADGTTWADTGITTAAFSKATAAAADAGQYRLKATNSRTTIYSNQVKAGNVCLRLVADINGNGNPDTLAPDGDRIHYKGALLQGQHYYSARLADGVTGNDVVPADWGFTTARMVATWATSNAALLPVSSVAANGQLLSNIPAPASGATATLTATFGNLKSEAKLTAP